MIVLHYLLHRQVLAMASLEVIQVHHLRCLVDIPLQLVVDTLYREAPAMSTLR